MTNHWIDMQHAKTILVEGSNVAENHPMAYKWIRKAQENGAKLIHVDPLFTRTSAGADVYARIRPGTDAAFLNTMINHILVHKLYDEDFVTTHTNALFLGDVEFDFKDGLFSGFNEEKHAYDTTTWGYQLDRQGQPRPRPALPVCGLAEATGLPRSAAAQGTRRHRKQARTITRQAPRDGGTREAIGRRGPGSN